MCYNYQEGRAEKLDSTPLQNKKKLVLTPLCYVKNNVAPPSHHPDFTKHLLSTGVLTTLAQNLKLLKPERERSKKKNQRTGDGTLQITDEKELVLYLDPWEESLLNFVMSQIYMEFSKSIQSMKKHYFYSHQKPTKLVYEICLIPIVLWGKLKNKFMIFALHRISSIN